MAWVSSSLFSSSFISLEHLPCSKAEFLEYIPYYLRNSTNTTKGRFLENVLEIINASAEGLLD
jgi:hypothetical protein